VDRLATARGELDADDAHDALSRRFVCVDAAARAVGGAAAHGGRDA